MCFIPQIPTLLLSGYSDGTNAFYLNRGGLSLHTQRDTCGTAFGKQQEELDVFSEVAGFLSEVKWLCVGQLKPPPGKPASPHSSSFSVQ